MKAGSRCRGGARRWNSPNPPTLGRSDRGRAARARLRSSQFLEGIVGEFHVKNRPRMVQGGGERRARCREGEDRFGLELLNDDTLNLCVVEIEMPDQRVEDQLDDSVDIALNRSGREIVEG